MTVEERSGMTRRGHGDDQKERRLGYEHDKEGLCGRNDGKGNQRLELKAF